MGGRLKPPAVTAEKVAKRHFFEFLRVFIHSDAHTVRAGLNIRGSHPLTTLGLIDRLLGLTNVRP